MAEHAANKGGSKYHVFYYDASRKVELAARLPAADHTRDDKGRSIEFEILAKLIQNDGKPKIAYYHYVKGRSPGFNPAINRTDPPEITKNRSDRTESPAITIGPRLKNLNGNMVTSHIAKGIEVTVINKSLEELLNFGVSSKRKVLSNTRKCLVEQEKLSTHTISEVKQEAAEIKAKDQTHSRQNVRQWQKRIRDANNNRTPKVYVRCTGGLIEEMCFKDYQDKYYTTPDRNNANKEGRVTKKHRKSPPHVAAATVAHREATEQFGSLVRKPSRAR